MSTAVTGSEHRGIRLSLLKGFPACINKKIKVGWAEGDTTHCYNPLVRKGEQSVKQRLTQKRQLPTFC